MTGKQLLPHSISQHPDRMTYNDALAMTDNDAHGAAKRHDWRQSLLSCLADQPRLADNIWFPQLQGAITNETDHTDPESSMNPQHCKHLSTLSQGIFSRGSCKHVRLCVQATERIFSSTALLGTAPTCLRTTWNNHHIQPDFRRPPQEFF